MCFTSWTLWRKIRFSERLLTELTDCAVIRLQALTCSYEGAFKAFSLLFSLYVVFIAFPIERFSLTLLLLYSGKMSVTHETTVVCFLLFTQFTYSDYCTETLLSNGCYQSVFNSYICLLCTYILLLKLKQQRFKILCVCVCVREHTAAAPKHHLQHHLGRCFIRGVWLTLLF